MAAGAGTRKEEELAGEEGASKMKPKAVVTESKRTVSWSPSSEDDEWTSCDGGELVDREEEEFMRMEEAIKGKIVINALKKSTVKSLQYADSFESSSSLEKTLGNTGSDMNFKVSLDERQFHESLLAGEEKKSNSKLFRNPSYHIAVTEKEPSPCTFVISSNLPTSNEEYSSREPSPGDCISDASGNASADENEDDISQHTVIKASEEKIEIKTQKASPIHAPGVEKSINIGRSVSFSERLITKSPNYLAPSCHSACNSRRTSASPSPVPNAEEDNNLTTVRPVRRLFSTPSALSAGVSPTYSNDSSFSPPTPGEQRKKSISRLTSSLARKLSFKSTKALQAKLETTFYQQNGLMEGSQDGVVSWEGLVRLFECPGCSSYMFPPLNQCRKGHLICPSCRTALKHICPICKQRFAENTNFMMEQVRSLYPNKIQIYYIVDYLLYVLNLFCTKILLDRIYN